MCEKIGVYKTFAHIFVCHSTHLSEAGFILPMAFRSSSASLSAKRVTTLSIIHARNKHKWLSAAKTPLLTRVGVARETGLGEVSPATSASPDRTLPAIPCVIGQSETHRRRGWTGVDDVRRMTANGFRECC